MRDGRRRCAICWRIARGHGALAAMPGRPEGRVLTTGIELDKAANRAARANSIGHVVADPGRAARCARIETGRSMQDRGRAGRAHATGR
jgi:hypothetical protein